MWVQPFCCTGGINIHPTLIQFPIWYEVAFWSGVWDNFKADPPMYSFCTICYTLPHVTEVCNSDLYNLHNRLDSAKNKNLQIRAEESEW